MESKERIEMKDEEISYKVRKLMREIREIKERSKTFSRLTMHQGLANIDIYEKLQEVKELRSKRVFK